MKNKVQSYLTESEIAQLLRMPNRMTLLGKRDYAILLLFIRTGIRLSELCNLRRGDLRTEGRKVWIYVYGKGGKQRRIPIRDHELLGALMQYWKKAGTKPAPESPMFTATISQNKSEDGRIRQTAVKYLVKKYAEMAQIQKPIHVHSLRHTFITHALRKSSDITAVQKLAGHSSITSTQVYLHTDDERMEMAIEKMQNF